MMRPRSHLTLQHLSCCSLITAVLGAHHADIGSKQPQLMVLSKIAMHHWHGTKLPIVHHCPPG